jgi:paraquat-inducible protein B
MARKPNPAWLGAFVVGAVILAVAGLVIFGGGRFFRSTQTWVAYFDESIKGLAVGAPVTFRGVKIGSVTSIKVVLDPKSVSARTPVYFELDPSRVVVAGGEESRFLRADRAGAPRAFELGLRAQLETQSFVTGQLAINLDFRPGTPIKFSGEQDKYPEFPTIPSTMSALGKGLEEVNLGELAKEAQAVLQGISRLVNGPEIMTALASANSALEGAKRLMASGETNISKLGTAFEGTAAKATDTLQDVQALVRRVDKQTVPALNGTLQDTQQLVRRVHAETLPAANQVLTDLRPLVADVRQAVGRARVVLERAETTLVSVDGALEENSPLGYQIKTTLADVSAAARAFRNLSSYLERYPDAVIFGKNGGRGK